MIVHLHQHWAWRGRGSGLIEQGGREGVWVVILGIEAGFYISNEE